MKHVPAAEIESVKRFMRRIPLNRLRWHTRIALWLGAAGAGLVVVGFAKLAEYSLDFFFLLIDGRPWLPLLLMPAVGMLAVWLTDRYFAGSEGSGIPQVIAATRMATLHYPVTALVSLRIAFGKILVGALTLAAGFTAGREGPSVQVAASLMHAVHRLLPHARAVRPQDLILAGGAAGVAAAFNTPLAGIVFAVEELGRRLETRTSGVLISTIILSGLVSIALLGNYQYFGHMQMMPMNRSIVVPVVIGGVLCGIAGGYFSRLMLWPQKAAHIKLWFWRARYPVRFAGACGLTLALIGLASGGLSYGSGYNVAQMLVSGSHELPWYTAIARFASTLVSYYSGIPGGIFAPSLAVGATLGGELAQLLGESVGNVPVIALCMAGFLAAVTQSPITATVIVMEMIDGHEMVISLMAISLIARGVSTRISPELYQTLAHGWQHKEQRRLDPTP
ncbi:MAG TPA: chloride channel protein [Rhodocyclaceae bacterium]|jgi:H+/Cl- antiporter ClcA